MARGTSNRKKRAHAGHRRFRRTHLDLKNRLRDADQLHDDVLAVAEGRALTHAADEDAAGGGSHYCVACARHFISSAVLAAHMASKPHKRRIKVLATEAKYTQEEADAGAGKSASDTAVAYAHLRSGVGAAPPLAVLIAAGGVDIGGGGGGGDAAMADATGDGSGGVGPGPRPVGSGVSTLRRLSKVEAAAVPRPARRSGAAGVGIGARVAALTSKAAAAAGTRFAVVVGGTRAKVGKQRRKGVTAVAGSASTADGDVAM